MPHPNVFWLAQVISQGSVKGETRRDGKNKWLGIYFASITRGADQVKRLFQSHLWCLDNLERLWNRPD